MFVLGPTLSRKRTRVRTWSGKKNYEDENGNAMRFRLRTPLDNECKYESTTTLIFKYLRDVNTVKTSIIVQYVEVLVVLKGRSYD